MKSTRSWTIFGLMALIGAAALAPAAVRADDNSRQATKNFWRNGIIAGAAATLYGLHNHDQTTAIVGAAGAAYSANRYEQDRHSQDQAARARARLYHRVSPAYNYRTYSGAYGVRRAAYSRPYYAAYRPGYARPRYYAASRRSSYSPRRRHRRPCGCR